MSTRCLDWKRFEYRRSTVSEGANIDALPRIPRKPKAAEPSGALPPSSGVASENGVGTSEGAAAECASGALTVRKGKEEENSSFCRVAARKESPPFSRGKWGGALGSASSSSSSSTSFCSASSSHRGPSHDSAASSFNRSSLSRWHSGWGDDGQSATSPRRSRSPCGEKASRGRTSNGHDERSGRVTNWSSSHPSARGRECPGDRADRRDTFGEGERGLLSPTSCRGWVRQGRPSTGRAQHSASTDRPEKQLPPTRCAEEGWCGGESGVARPALASLHRSLGTSPIDRHGVVTRDSAWSVSAGRHGLSASDEPRISSTTAHSEALEASSEEGASARCSTAAAPAGSSHCRVARPVGAVGAGSSHSKEAECGLPPGRSGWKPSCATMTERSSVGGQEEAEMMPHDCRATSSCHSKGYPSSANVLLSNEATTAAAPSFSSSPSMSSIARLDAFGLQLSPPDSPSSPSRVDATVVEGAEGQENTAPATCAAALATSSASLSGGCAALPISAPHSASPIRRLASLHDEPNMFQAAAGAVGATVSRPGAGAGWGSREDAAGPGSGWIKKGRPLQVGEGDVEGASSSSWSSRSAGRPLTAEGKRRSNPGESRGNRRVTSSESLPSSDSSRGVKRRRLVRRHVGDEDSDSSGKENAEGNSSSSFGDPETKAQSSASAGSAPRSMKSNGEAAERGGLVEKARSSAAEEQSRCGVEEREDVFDGGEGAKPVECAESFGSSSSRCDGGGEPPPCTTGAGRAPAHDGASGAGRNVSRSGEKATSARNDAASSSAEHGASGVERPQPGRKRSRSEPSEEDSSSESEGDSENDEEALLALQKCLSETEAITERIVDALAGADPAHRKEIRDNIRDGRCNAHRSFNTPAKLEKSCPDFGRLKEYQKCGILWLMTLHSCDRNGILADEMGLGKTAQTCSFLNYLYLNEEVTSSTIIACPASLLDNWMNELQLWAPFLSGKIMKYHGKQSERREFALDFLNLQGSRDQYLVLLTSTSTLTSKWDAQYLKQIRPIAYLVVDEAHSLKNKDSMIYRKMNKVLKCNRRLLLTGSPIQNSTEELRNLVLFLMPHVFDDDFLDLALSAFGEQSRRENAVLSDATSEEQGDGVGGKDLIEALQSYVKQQSRRRRKLDPDVLCLQRIVSPYILRRLKSEVLQDLPKKLNKVVRCNMEGRQKELYVQEITKRDTMLATSLRSLTSCLREGKDSTQDSSRKDCHSTAAEDSLCEPERKGKSDGQQSAESLKTSALQRSDSANCDPESRTWERSRDAASAQGEKKAEISEKENKAFVNSLLARLRRICNHPLMMQGYYSDEALADIINHYYLRVDGFKGNPFKKVDEEIRKWSDYEIHQGVRALTCQGDDHLAKYLIPPDMLMESAKIREMVKLVKEIKSRGEKALVFSQYTSYLDVIAECLSLNCSDIVFYRLDGSTNVSGRQGMVDDFNANPEITLFLLSTKAGGQGLNLVGARTVILMDQDWNPHNDRQAEDRVHRLGQKHDVTILRLCCRGSVEESILKCCKRKLDLDDAFGGNTELLQAALLLDSLDKRLEGSCDEATESGEVSE